MSGYYNTALVCLNGHVINCYADTQQERNAPFCHRCGQPTICECPGCKARIRGEHHTPGVVVFSTHPFSAAGYCYACGAPYPWTEAKLQAAREMIDEVEELTSEQRETFKRDLGDIAVNTPRTELAASRIKTRLAALPGVIGNGLRVLVVDIASETAKKLLAPGP